MQLEFLGGAGSVTGSKFLLRSKNGRVLIDCGLFQGLKELRLRNWAKLPVEASSIDAVIITHAHLDHSGYIPLLVKQGFAGNIWCTPATLDLCELLLPDSGYIQEEDARYANRRGYSRHHPAEPLYTKNDAEACLSRFKTVNFDQIFFPLPGIEATFSAAGHILGAASVLLGCEGKKILVSGDLGTNHDPVMKPPAKPPAADYVLIESTYGNRLHLREEHIASQLAKIINHTAKKGGAVLIPAFAVGRAQHILYEIWDLKQKKQIPDIPVYMDSPMATNATRLFFEYNSQHRLSPETALAVCKTARYVQSVNDSKAVSSQAMPRIIISASGMATGGRVVHHLRHFLPNHRHAIVFCGYQAAGTRGDRLVRGEREVKMFGEMIRVAATIYNLDGMSAHADQSELLQWLQALPKPPREVFVVHGEAQASVDFCKLIEEKMHWRASVAGYQILKNL